jgi:CBS domain-containing protein
MRHTTPIRSVLAAKGSEIYGLPPDASVFSAIEMMATRSVGALLVIQDGKLIGILSERDYARKVILLGRASKDTRIKEIMTSPVTFVTPDCTVDEAMSLMTQKRIRHLPILENEQVIGLVSIGDLVKYIVSEQADTIEHLHAYITGQYPR